MVVAVTLTTLAVAVAIVDFAGGVLALAPEVVVSATDLLDRDLFWTFGVALVLSSVGVKERSLPFRAGVMVLARWSEIISELVFRLTPAFLCREPSVGTRPGQSALKIL